MNTKDSSVPPRLRGENDFFAFLIFSVHYLRGRAN